MGPPLSVPLPPLEPLADKAAEHAMAAAEAEEGKEGAAARALAAEVLGGLLLPAPQLSAPGASSTGGHDTCLRPPSAERLCSRS
jgi:hypothetical protein